MFRETWHDQLHETHVGPSRVTWNVIQVAVVYLYVITYWVNLINGVYYFEMRAVVSIDCLVLDYDYHQEECPCD